MQFFFHSLGEHGGILLQRECVSRGISGPNQCWISGEGQAVLQETAVSHASPVSQTSALKLRNFLPKCKAVIVFPDEVEMGILGDFNKLWLLS